MSVMPGTLDFTCPQGTTFERTLTYKADGTPVNLSGYSARMQVRLNYQSASPVLSLASGSGITISGSAGTIALLVSASTTSAMSPSTYVYDLEIQSGGGEVSRLIEGRFIVTPEVTR